MNQIINLKLKLILGIILFFACSSISYASFSRGCYNDGGLNYYNISLDVEDFGNSETILFSDKRCQLMNDLVPPVIRCTAVENNIHDPNDFSLYITENTCIDWPNIGKGKWQKVDDTHYQCQTSTATATTTATNNVVPKKTAAPKILKDDNYRNECTQVVGTHSLRILTTVNQGGDKVTPASGDICYLVDNYNALICQNYSNNVKVTTNICQEKRWIQSDNIYMCK